MSYIIFRVKSTWYVHWYRMYYYHHHYHYPVFLYNYGLDGPGSNPGGDENFRLLGPALGSTQHPVKLVPVLSRG